MDMRQIVVVALQISIMATVFSFGLRSTSADLIYLVRRPGLLGRSLLAMLVIMPLVTLALTRAFDFVRAIEISLIALSLSPVPPLLPKRQVASGGSESYGVALMATLGLLSIVTVPLAVELLERLLGLPLGMSPEAIASVVVRMIVGPLAIGVLIRAFAPGPAARVAGLVAALATALLGLALLPLLVVGVPAAWNMIGNGSVVAIVLFVLVGLTTGHLLGGPGHQEATVLALATACRHPAIAFAVASANFPEERFGGAILLYLLVSLLATVPYASWQKKHTAPSAASW